jgi:sugar lactone lactonase YvrE
MREDGSMLHFKTSRALQSNENWRVERIAEFNGWPSGVAVSSHGRIFVSFPQANYQLSAATLCEVENGIAFPFPFAGFTSIHGLCCGENDSIYALDTGSTDLSGCNPKNAALWVLDAHAGTVLERHTFDADVVLPSSYLIDFAMDARHGAAYLLDAGREPPNALIVLDLDTGGARRVLNDHPSLRVSPSLGRRGLLADRKPLLVRDTRGHAQPVQAGAIGIALHRNTLYWSKPDTLFSLDSHLLLDPQVSAAQLDAAIRTWPLRPFASDGLVHDRSGHILLTDVTHNGVQRLSPGLGNYELLVSDPRISWPDGIAVGPDEAIYVTSSQFHRSSLFNDGVDRRRAPFSLFRLSPAGLNAA